VTRLKWKLVLIHLEIVLILMQDGCVVYFECTIAQKLFRMHPMELPGDMCLGEFGFGPFADGVSVDAR
jgi:hypothetical protein